LVRMGPGDGDEQRGVERLIKSSSANTPNGTANAIQKRRAFKVVIAKQNAEPLAFLILDMDIQNRLARALYCASVVDLLQ
jgi:hypothetical protein